MLSGSPPPAGTEHEDARGDGMMLELKVIAVCLVVLAVAMLYAIGEYLWRERRRTSAWTPNERHHPASDSTGPPSMRDREG